MANFLIYGANGYTGSLIAREAVLRGHRPFLAGRNPDTVAALARELDLEYRIFSLDNPAVVVEGLRDAQVVLHCAGPFSHTSKPMADACLRCSIHYLDITGEDDVFETLAARDVEAKAAGIMLLPGVGFDVVPSDCLAAHLKKRLPSATRLVLGFLSLSRLSRGTALTVVENLHLGGLVRQHGILRRVPAAWKTRVIDFGTGPLRAMTIPWGDVTTAYYSTGIPNIEVYMAAPWSARFGARVSRHLGWFLGSSLMQNILKKKIRSGPLGPTKELRASGKSFLWGEVLDDSGKKAVSRLRGAEPYTLSVQAALAVVEHVLAGQVTPGFQTPSMAYGPDFILGLQGIVREDE
jgi:short subunit dehydrogenase-like uncharacterized protein